jgi:hypothetical protein
MCDGVCADSRAELQGGERENRLPTVFTNNCWGVSVGAVPIHDNCAISHLLCLCFRSVTQLVFVLPYPINFGVVILYFYLRNSII